MTSLWDAARSAYTALGPWAELLKYLAAVATAIVFLLRWRARKRKRQDAMADALIESERDIAALRRQLEESEQFDPAVWLRRYEDAHATGSRDTAIDHLVHGVSSRVVALHSVYKLLAAESLELSEQLDSLEQKLVALREAARYADICCRLLPDEASGWEQYEIVRVQAAVLSVSFSRPVDVSPPTPAPPPAVAALLVPKLLMMAERQDLLGHLILGERLAFKAREIALQRLDHNDLMSFNARWRWAGSKTNLGDCRAALKEISSYLADLERIHGDCDVSLGSRMTRARCLLDLGRLSDARSDVDFALPKRLALSGQDDKATVILQILRSTIRAAQGESQAAYEDLTSLLQADLSAPVRHENVPLAHSTRVMCLRKLGRFDEALVEADVAIKSAINDFGESNVRTLQIKSDRPRVLARLPGRLDEAIVEVDSLIRETARHLGDGFPLVRELQQARRGFCDVASGKASFGAAADEPARAPSSRVSKSKR